MWFFADLPDERRSIPVQCFPEIELHCLRCAVRDVPVIYAIFTIRYVRYEYIVRQV